MQINHSGKPNNPQAQILQNHIQNNSSSLNDSNNPIPLLQILQSLQLGAQGNPPKHLLNSSTSGPSDMSSSMQQFKEFQQFQAFKQSKHYQEYQKQYLNYQKQEQAHH